MNAQTVQTKLTKAIVKQIENDGCGLLLHISAPKKPTANPGIIKAASSTSLKAFLLNKKSIIFFMFTLSQIDSYNTLYNFLHLRSHPFCHHYKFYAHQFLKTKVYSEHILAHFAYLISFP